MSAEVITKSVEEVTLSKEEDNGDFVDPWNVESKNDSGLDYDKLISRFKSIPVSYDITNIFLNY